MLTDFMYIVALLLAARTLVVYSNEYSHDNYPAPYYCATNHPNCVVCRVVTISRDGRVDSDLINSQLVLVQCLFNNPC